MFVDDRLEIRPRPSRGKFKGKDLKCFAVFRDGKQIGMIAQETMVHRWPSRSWKRKGVIQTSISPRWVIIRPVPVKVEKFKTRKAAIEAVVSNYESRKLAAKLVTSLTGVRI